MPRAKPQRKSKRPRKESPKGESLLTAAYAELSTRPLHVLVFLAPLLAIYEVGSVLYLSNPSTGLVETISARRMISAFFEAFGAFGLYLPGLALATVLLVWHVLRKDPWTIHVPVLPVMAMESVVWTIPLVVLAMLLPRLAPMAGWEGVALAGADIRELSWQARLTISIGAGLYEELVFRVVAIALVHLLLVDVLGAGRKPGAIAAVVVAALAFALYHDLSTPTGGVNIPLAIFLMAAGLYFGLLYIWRGFGIVVAVHALYDIVALVLAPSRG